MSETLKIYGWSDDTVTVDGISGESESYESFGKPTFLLIESPDGGKVFVRADYGFQGTWAIGVAPFEEDVEIPDWNISIVTDPELCGYSAVLLADVPDGTKVSQVDKRGELI